MYFLKTSVLTAALALTVLASQQPSAANTLSKGQNLRYSGHNNLPTHAIDNQSGQISNKVLLTKSAKISTYLNSKSEKFVVDGAKIPDIPFDVGESYAGLLPISNKTDEERKLYFWFFPSEEPKASDEIAVWFNGGPGCSSLLGLLTENGPFLWQDGTNAIVKNPYSWSRLTNVVWIEQPAGTGFSQGEANARDEHDVADQFRGFWKNFVDTFDLGGRKIYLAGESYAGMYVPYIANNFLEANDTTFFNLKGIAINDPVIGNKTLQLELPYLEIAEYWSNLFGLNRSTVRTLNDLADRGGYRKYTEKYFRFPPVPQPWDDSTTSYQNFSDILFAVLTDQNPCFNLNHLTDTCPFTSGNLGTFFNRPDVQKAINAPTKKWRLCTGRPFVNDVDGSPGPALDGTLANIIAKTQNVLIGSGGLDLNVPTNGTLFALQNTTWGGAQGFHEYPSHPFYVPFHDEDSVGPIGGSGTLGVWREERGLTFYEIHLAGHEVPGWAASGGYRAFQRLLGRISDFNSTAPLF